MMLNETYDKVCKEVLNHSSVKHDINSAILALHESATKLWQATTNQQGDKINLRVAAALISVFYVMQELGIENPEECLKQKLDELEKEKQAEVK
ncbi:MAG: hypothetical protein AAB444_01245 [Patescibacteria group bacterium]